MKAWQVIDSPDKWCTGHYALTAEGAPVYGTACSAVRFCALGALSRAYSENSPEYMNARNKLEGHMPILSEYDTLSIHAWNDAADWQTVYSLLKELDI